MSPERLREIEELYHSARERSPAGRADLLEQADPELRREVESLLAQQGENGPLDHPAMEVAARLLDDETQTRLTVGEQLGPYKIEGVLGAGGMGQVYKARDTRLGRCVAIKVSSKQFNTRFEREARAISALNHPHICILYDVGPDYLVMELVDGSTLAEKLKRGPLPMESVLRYGAQIADALAAAHAQGIIHRDLKPGNIMLTKSGMKVLDFGLAKSTQDETLTSSQVVMGSPAYMAPEQREGRMCDARTDIYALGLILYEMATGKRLQHDQPHFPDDLPEGLAHVIRRCLEMEPERRWQSASDVRAELEWVATPNAQTRAALLANPRKWMWIAATVMVGLVVGTLAIAYLTRKAPDTPLARFTLAPPFKAEALDVAVSPDGKRIAFADSQGGSALWLRSVDSLSAEKLPGTESAIRPFWSPDGLSLGFISDDGLKRVDLSRAKSSIQTITSLASFGGGAWSPEGIILYQPEQTGTGLSRVPANGGAPVPATKLNSERKEIVHRYPQFLPNGRHFIYWVWSASEENTGTYVGSLDPKEKLPEGPLVRTWREARYVDPGYLLWLQGSTLVAQRFDAAQLRLIGEPHSLPEPVGVDWGHTGRAMLSASFGGILAYQEAVPPTGSKFVWRDRAGNQIRAIQVPPGSSVDSLDPHEKRLVIFSDDENALEDLWVVELDRATVSRVTSTHGSSMLGIWSPDGRRIAFQSNRSGVYDLYAKDANGVGEEELLVKSEHQKVPTGWSPDGRYLVYVELDPKTKGDIWVLPLAGDRKPFPFLKTEFNESDATLSPVPDRQGHLWMAYKSDETGRDEIYLRPFLPGTSGGPAGAKVRVSIGGGGLPRTSGGSIPRWRRDGRELFYFAAGKLMAVDVKLGISVEVGTPHALFDVPINSGTACFTCAAGERDWVSFADGRRFLFAEPSGEPQAPKINVVLNWTAELKR